jgi:hypothetical protein
MAIGSIGDVFGQDSQGDARSILARKRHDVVCRIKPPVVCDIFFGDQLGDLRLSIVGSHEDPRRPFVGKGECGEVLAVDYLAQNIKHLGFEFGRANDFDEARDMREQRIDGRLPIWKTVKFHLAPWAYSRSYLFGFTIIF